MIETITRNSDILELLCKHKKKWGMFISFNPNDVKFSKNSAILKDAPWLNFNDHAEVMLNGCGYFFADTREDLYKLYDQVLGDDHGGKCYALTCNRQGKLQTENT